MRIDVSHRVGHTSDSPEVGMSVNSKPFLYMLMYMLGS